MLEPFADRLTVGFFPLALSLRVVPARFGLRQPYVHHLHLSYPSFPFPFPSHPLLLPSTQYMEQSLNHETSYRYDEIHPRGARDEHVARTDD